MLAGGGNNTRRRLAGRAVITKRKIVDQNDVAVRSLQGSWYVGPDDGGDSADDHFPPLASANETLSAGLSHRHRNYPWLTPIGRVQQFSLRQRESESYVVWARAVENLPITDSKIILVFGNKLSTISAKLSLRMSAGILVSILTDRLAVLSHETLLDIMSVGNGFVCYSALYPQQLAALVESPDVADIGLIQIDVLMRLISISNASSDVFEESLAALISLSTYTIIEMPSREGLLQILTSPLLGPLAGMADFTPLHSLRLMEPHCHDLYAFPCARHV